MAVKIGFEYIAKFVKHRMVQGQPITSFSIGDKVKGGSGTQYQNYDFTVWGEHVTIPENSRVTIDKIDSIGCRSYNGRTYFDISGKITPKQMENVEYAEETAAYSIDKSSDGKTKNFESEDTFVALDDDDTALPFDL